MIGVKKMAIAWYCIEAGWLQPPSPMEHRVLHHPLPQWNRGGGLLCEMLSQGNVRISIRQHYTQTWQWHSAVCNGNNWTTSNCKNEESSSGEGKKLSAVLASCCTMCESQFAASLHLPSPGISPSSLQESPVELSPTSLPTAFPVSLIPEDESFASSPFLQQQQYFGCPPLAVLVNRTWPGAILLSHTWEMHGGLVAGNCQIYVRKVSGSL